MFIPMWLFWTVCIVGLFLLYCLGKNPPPSGPHAAVSGGQYPQYVKSAVLALDKPTRKVAYVYVPPITGRHYWVN